MKRPLLLVLLLSLALAQCSVIVAEAEATYEPYIGMVSVDCDAQHAKNFYDDLSALAGDYERAADCFKEKNDEVHAVAYYLLAGEKYRVAADALCDSDYPLKMQLYISAGDAYRAASDTDTARQLYESAEALYLAHMTTIPALLNADVQGRLHELDYPVPGTIQDVKTSDEADWTLIAFAVIVVVGLGLLMVTLMRKR